MRIEPNVIREVLARTDLAAFIGGYVSLQKRGNDLVGLCPFHSEKTPSFHVHPDRGFFKCFGCGAGGDAVAFLQKLESIPFPEALRVLAKRAGVEVEAEDPRSARVRGEKEALYEANALAAAFFHRVLRASDDGAAGRAYCERRVLTSATIESFTLGFAPERWDALLGELRQAGVDPEVAEKAGLLKRGERGFYDFYRGRLMIPTYAATGEVIAFGARALGDAEPKYLNTSTTPVYTKGRHLYALNVARKHAAALGSLIVVEGYLDCIALHQAGFPNAVASLGTSFTPDQAAEMRKYTENVFLCFDADRAGSAATGKSIDVFSAVKTIENVGNKVRIVRLPPGEDPDTLVGRGGADAFARLLDEAVPAIQFKLDAELEALRSRFSDSASLARKSEELIRQLTPREEWDRWRVYVASRLKVNVDDLRNSRFLANRTNFAPLGVPGRANFSRHVAPATAPVTFERDVLQIVVEEPALTREFAARIAPERFENAEYRRIYATLVERAGDLVFPADVLALFAEDPEALALLASLQLSERSGAVRFGDSEQRRLHLERIVERLELDVERRRLRELDRRIDELLNEGKSVPADLRNEFSHLVAKLKG